MRGVMNAISLLGSSTWSATSRQTRHRRDTSENTLLRATLGCIVSVSPATGGGEAEHQARGGAGEAAIEEEQLHALLRDLDALKQHPDDLASIDRLPPSHRAAPWISAVYLSISPSRMRERVVAMMSPAAGAASRSKIKVRSDADFHLRVRRTTNWAMRGGGGQQPIQQTYGAAALN
ncbi:hypothetical protein HU200_041853 [Digitaria exilis]|uniref:Uncharacterized protein n=1 Tax=Digitaria exilis TaxID=1010633 RepID=A0A835BHE5_9POAL|nr:hypothetical protein HU200_041853 [Digitaria exilis]